MSSTASNRRHAIGLAAFVALAISVPLAAQEAPDALEQAAAAAPSDEVVAQFGLEVVAGEAAIVAAHPIGETLPPDSWVCLDRMQFLVVRADGEEIAYTGAGCLETRESGEIPDEAYAGTHVWQPLTEDSPRWTGGNAESAIVAASSGPSAEAHPAGRRFTGDEKIVLLAGDRLTLLGWHGSRVLTGPGTFDITAARNPARAASAAAAPSRRARIGAVRGFPPPAIERLIATRGTPGALQKFPRGTLIGSAQKICLAQGDRLTVARRSGARTTYAGPGCGRSVEGSGEDNTAAVTPG